jgi:hypothetical protein
MLLNNPVCVDATKEFERVVDDRVVEYRKSDRVLLRAIPRLRSFALQCRKAYAIARERRAADHAVYGQLGLLLREGASPSAAAMAWYEALRGRVEAGESLDATTFTLRDIGWRPSWRRPDPDSRVFNNSESRVINDLIRGVVHTIPSLLAYGLTPEDMSPAYVEVMVERGHIPRCLVGFDGDWLELCRSFVDINSPSAWLRRFGEVPFGIGEEA